MCQAADVRMFKAGKVLFSQDRSDRHPVVVVRGLLKASVITQDGEEMLLRLHGPGDVAGLSYEKSRLVAVQDTTVRPAFLTPAATRLLTKQRLEAMEQRFIDSHTKTVAQRLAETLLGISDQIKNPIVPLPQYSLAQMIGTTNYSISRFVRHWQRSGVIRLVKPDKSAPHKSNRVWVEILDRDKLLKSCRVVIDGYHGVIAPRRNNEYRVSQNSLEEQIAV